MRLVFGMMSLLVILAVVGVLVKKQLGATTASQDAAHATQSAVAPGTKNLQLQRQQIEQQFKLSVEAAMQRPSVADSQ